jgi:hypothetical protein
MSDKPRSERTQDGESLPPAAVYVKPALTHYGSVAKLTQNMTGSQKDGGQENRRASCL